MSLSVSNIFSQSLSVSNNYWSKRTFCQLKNPSFNLFFPETDPGSHESFSQDAWVCVNFSCILQMIGYHDVRSSKTSQMSNRKKMCQMKNAMFFSPKNPHAYSYLKNQPSKSLFVSFRCHIQRQSQSQHKTMMHGTSLKISTPKHSSIQNRNKMIL